MVGACKLDPEAIYDDGSLYLSLGISPSALAKARRTGELKFTRKGKKVLYRGQWLLDWFNLDVGDGREVCQ